MAGAGGGWLPDEIAFDILPRLRSTASVARFRCVSKSWRWFLSLLLRDPNFLRKAIFFSDEDDKEINNKARLMFASTRLNSYSINSLDDTLQTISSGALPSDFYKLEGCWDGIFCISSGERIALWNPTDSKVKVLPSHLQFLGPLYAPRNLQKDYTSYGADIGFGFDPKTNDYKVVFTCKPWHMGRLTCIYSLRKDKWRHLDQTAILDQPGTTGSPSSIGRKVGVFGSASGSSSSCLWRDEGGYGRDHLNLKMFDMSREAFTQLRLPMPDSSVHEFYGSGALELMATNGPCLIAINYGIRKFSGTTTVNFFKVWVTLDYVWLAKGKGKGKVKCSWIRLYDIVSSDNNTRKLFPCYDRYLKVLVFWKHGKWLARAKDGDKFVVIDAEKNKWGGLDRYYARMLLSQVVTYVPNSTILLTA